MGEDENVEVPQVRETSSLQRTHVMGNRMDGTKFSSKSKFSHLNLVDLVVAKVEDLKLAQVGEEPSPDLKFQQNYPESEFGLGCCPPLPADCG